HHFIMSCEYSGRVKVQKSFDSDETEILIAQVSSISKAKNSDFILSDTITPSRISFK
ncbi:3856_t:CDS:1, partial [Racocetra persica]